MGSNRGTLMIRVHAEKVGVTLTGLIRHYRWSPDYPPGSPLGFVATAPNGERVFLGASVDEACTTIDEMAKPPGRRPPKKEH